MPLSLARPLRSSADSRGNAFINPPRTSVTAFRDSRSRTFPYARFIPLRSCRTISANVADDMPNALTSIIGLFTESRTGAPRPMKMGNSASPWPYDVGAYHTLEPENMRLPAIQRCARSAGLSDVAGHYAEVDRKLTAGRQNDATSRRFGLEGIIVV
jgi:hypothetical protein